MKAELQGAFNVVVKYGFCSDCRWRLNSKECRTCDCYQNGVMLIQDALEKASVGVDSVVHGRWIDNGSNGYKWAFICSKCGYIDGHPFDDRYNFCPNCGAKMDGGE